MWIVPAVLLVVIIATAVSGVRPKKTEELQLRYEVLETIPHDDDCFTQGLHLYEGKLYESCGLYGKSSLRIVDPATGAVIKRNPDPFPREIFSEGIYVLPHPDGARVYMLTWREGQMWVFSAESLKHLFTVPFHSSGGQGWGLTHDGSHFIASDGTDALTYMNVPADAADVVRAIKTVSVHNARSGASVRHVNELQVVGTSLWANIWYKDVLLRLDPTTGDVLAELDLTQLWPRKKRTKKADCLNGIAYDAQRDRYLLTGKLWDSYFWVRIEEHDGQVQRTTTGSPRKELL